MNEDDVLKVCLSVWDEQDQLPKLIATLNGIAARNIDAQGEGDKQTINKQVKFKVEIGGTSTRSYWKSKEDWEKAIAKACNNWTLLIQALYSNQAILQKPLVVRFSSPTGDRPFDEPCSSNAEFKVVTQIAAFLCPRLLSVQVTMDDQVAKESFVKSLTEFLQKFAPIFSCSLTFRSATSTTTINNSTTTLQVADDFFAALLGIHKLNMHLALDEHQQEQDSMPRQAPVAVSFCHYLSQAWTNPSSHQNRCRLRSITLHGNYSHQNDETAAEAAIRAFFQLFQQSHNTMHWLSMETAAPFDHPGGCTMMQGFSCPYRQDTGLLFWRKDDETKADLTLHIFGWPSNLNHGVCPLELAICNSLEQFGTLPPSTPADPPAVGNVVGGAAAAAAAAAPSTSGCGCKRLKHLDVFFGRTTTSNVLERLLRNALGTNKVLQQQLRTLSLGIFCPSSSRLQHLYSYLVDLVPQMTSLRELTARPIFEVFLTPLPLPGRNEEEQLRRFPTQLTTSLLDGLRANTCIERFDCCEHVLRDSSRHSTSSSINAVSKIRLICRRNQLRKLMDAIIKGVMATADQVHRHNNMGETSPLLRPIALLPLAIKAVHDNHECQEESFSLIYNTLRVVLPNIADDKF
ncbi:expressed unknown protein [Seminavis robusta]|uniref:Uncharacterized protein n=1 Tax=Seminavis robusta TaxID=568900 RepID=A0A9N8H7V4_9STRA|nr:expressed unknown protein [Seminavis robusta]|eukprot:Sro195_g083110.1 n/a (629) ;mRNA; f:16348-18234